MKSRDMKTNKKFFLHFPNSKLQGRQFSFFLIFFLSSVFCFLSSVTNTNADVGANWRSFTNVGKFITAVEWDKNGQLWVAGEEFGVSLIDEKTIKKFDIPYCYTIECDNRGRVWFGSLRQGLYCYEFGELKNFNTSNGFPSNSVYAVAFDKYDTPYCATGLGVVKYSEGKCEMLDLPSHLPQSEICAIDFDEDGNLWVGFFLGGVAKFNGWDWKLYTHEDKYFNKNISEDFNRDGRVNDILAARDGTVWVGTCYGVNRLLPKEEKWQHLYLLQTHYPANYFLDIAEDGYNNVLLANRHNGIIRGTSKNSNLSRVVSTKKLPSDFVSCVTTDNNGYVWAGTYGGGITTNNPLFRFPGRIRERKTPIEKDSLKNFSEKTYQRDLIFKYYKEFKNTNKKEYACYIGEDWLTRGNWLGNYGEYSWILCAYSHFSGVFDDLEGSSDKVGSEYFNDDIKYSRCIGENVENDIIRGWLYWDYTENPKALQDPLGGGRRHAEWDDHAEALTPLLLREGPHLYLNLEIPEGIFVVSFYFMNKDAHEGKWNRYRDYTISVKRGIKRSVSKTFHKKETGEVKRWSTSSEEEFESAPLLASCRVHDFRAGVYKRFMLKGPAAYTIKFDKQESYNTNLSAVFIDKIEKAE